MIYSGHGRGGRGIGTRAMSPKTSADAWNLNMNMNMKVDKHHVWGPDTVLWERTPARTPQDHAHL